MNTNDSKNNAKSSFSTFFLENDFSILMCQNNTVDTQYFTQEIPSDIIRFHFCLKGSANLNYNQGQYSRGLNEDDVMFVYNPEKALPLDIEVHAHSSTVSLLIALRKFHQLFSRDASYIDFLKEEERHKKYYRESSITPAMAVVLSQVLNFNLHPSVQPIYLKGKVYELIGLYFNRPETVDTEQCPFLVDEDGVRKIKHAKEIIIAHMAEPPTLKALAEEIGLGLKKLKEGFKEVYGETVFGFLFNYKMDYAQKLLESGKYNVNEVGLQVGYSTASHFIAAYKKRFGTTPKKYLQSLSTNTTRSHSS